MAEATLPTRDLTGLGLSTTSIAAGEVGDDLPAAPSAAGARYLVLDKLGEGGHGVVYTAYDRKLDRKVALKLGLARGGGAPASRLVREAQALARLKHPNVVTVYDVGLLDDDRWFVAMELVEGSSLRSWLAGQPRAWRAIVAVFLAAGRGLAAAHAAGLVHRDVKPDNILVGADGVARIADFGVARILADGSPAEPGVGTPRYMAPEQRDAGDADPRADQYSFCLALTMALDGRAAPAFVRRALERGTRRDPDERFPDMTALLAVLGRDPARLRRRAAAAVLALAAAGGLVLAGAAWRSRRAAMCTGAGRRVGTLWDEARRDAVRAAFAAVPLPYAARAADRAVQGLDAWTAGWAAAYRDACEATQLRGEQSAAVMDARMDCLAELLADAGAVVAALTAADAPTVNRAENLVASLAAPGQCARRGEEDRERLPADPARRAAFEHARQEIVRARALLVLGKRTEARAIVEAALPAARAAGNRRAEVRALLVLGAAQEAEGDAPAAQARFEEALYAAAGAGDQLQMIHAAAALAIDLGRVQRRFDEGRQLGRLALATAERLGDAAAPGRAHQALGLIEVVAGRGEEAYAELSAALALYEQAYGPDDVQVNNLRNSLGNAALVLGRYDEALARYGAALASQERTVGPDHPHVATTLMSMVNVHYDRQQHAQAEPLLRRAIAIRAAAMGPRSVEVAESTTTLGWVHYELGRHAEAERELREALALFDGLPGRGAGNPDHRARALRGLATTLTEEGRLDEAAGVAREALAVTEARVGPSHVDVAPVLDAVAYVDRRRKDFGSAAAELERALAIPGVAGTPLELLLLTNLAGTRLEAGGRQAASVALDRALAAVARVRAGGGEPRLALAVEIGSGLVDVGRTAEAVELLEHAVAAAERAGELDGDPRGAAWARFHLARALWDAGGDRARARALAERARAALTEDSDAGKRADVASWLAARPEGP